MLLLLSIPQIIFGQQNELTFFESLMQTNWKAEGNWGDGSAFKQEVNFQYDLDSNLVIASSKGFIDDARKQFGPRNHGIRKFDQATKQLKFWEFDIFGGTTEGVISIEDKNIIYQYKYGDSFVTDMWIYVNDSTYNFKVGEYSNGVWNQVYLSTQFKAVDNANNKKAYNTLANHLIGSWAAPTWDGELIEVWKLNNEGQLTQSAAYIENGKTLYAAKNKMEWIDDELILFTVIKDSNPKIFKATSFSQNEIVFENSDYTNPNKVVYKFSEDSTFQRFISGTENNAPSTFTFNFKRQ